MNGHYSDCAVHNEPAYPKGDCDCGYRLQVERKYVRMILLRAYNRVLRFGTMYRSWIWREFHAPVEFSSPVARWIRCHLKSASN